MTPGYATGGVTIINEQPDDMMSYELMCSMESIVMPQSLHVKYTSPEVMKYNSIGYNRLENRRSSGMATASLSTYEENPDANKLLLRARRPSLEAKRMAGSQRGLRASADQPQLEVISSLECMAEYCVRLRAATVQHCHTELAVYSVLIQAVSCAWLVDCLGAREEVTERGAEGLSITSCGDICTAALIACSFSADSVLVAYPFSAGSVLVACPFSADSVLVAYPFSAGCLSIQCWLPIHLAVH